MGAPFPLSWVCGVGALALVAFAKRLVYTRRMCKRIFSLFLAAAIALLAGCRPEPKRYTYSFFDAFDTYVQLTAYARSERDFARFSAEISEVMREMHRLFDIYAPYEGLNNAYTVNENAGVEPVQVDEHFIELVGIWQHYYPKTKGTMDITLGPLVALWNGHRDRALQDPSQASVPDKGAIAEAAARCDPDALVVDPQARTVFLSEEGMRLDLGAIAKGYAVQVAAQQADDTGIECFLINAGGNVLASGTPPGGAWNVGVADPAAEDAGEGELLSLLRLTDQSAVTSGDYQRYYFVDGVRYAHILDPATGRPAREFRSVTLIGESSTVADILSTALFVLPYQDGLELAQAEGYDAIWVLPDGQVRTTQGALDRMHEAGNR